MSSFCEIWTSLKFASKNFIEDSLKLKSEIILTYEVSLKKFLWVGMHSSNTLRKFHWIWFGIFYLQNLQNFRILKFIFLNLEILKVEFGRSGKCYASAVHDLALWYCLRGVWQLSINADDSFFGTLIKVISHSALIIRSRTVLSRWWILWTCHCSTGWMGFPAWLSTRLDAIQCIFFGMLVCKKIEH